MQTISQQDFTQQPLKAWQSSQSEPIFITDKDENSRVLLSYARYQQLLEMMNSTNKQEVDKKENVKQQGNQRETLYQEDSHQETGYDEWVYQRVSKALKNHEENPTTGIAQAEILHHVKQTAQQKRQSV